MRGPVSLRLRRAARPGTAARLLDASHRLALSGTPIENHLGELWSLFEFLNPGMLGRAAVFQRLAGRGGSLAEADRDALQRALKPFILRRTKAAVEHSLPSRTEQTVLVELAPPQRELVERMRRHYQRALLGKADAATSDATQMHVLEALLRLRQAACHPKLIEAGRPAADSAKFDALLPMLRELAEEGHKVLVFSQFTSLLDLLVLQLAEANLGCVRLDGSTRDRDLPVERFQTDPDVHVFLISLRAGGTGLNLTAADYVFLLDPWWNPAVEAQAIDRAHRIGQSRPVVAYRLVARGTVEEKTLQLQESKRALAQPIVEGDAAGIGALRREDLELLLGDRPRPPARAVTRIPRRLAAPRRRRCARARRSRPA